MTEEATSLYCCKSLTVELLIKLQGPLSCILSSQTAGNIKSVLIVGISNVVFRSVSCYNSVICFSFKLDIHN